MRGNKRKIYFIEKKFQAQFIVKFCLLVILGSLMAGALLYLFSSKATTVSFENTKAVVKSTSDFILPILIQTIVIVFPIVAFFTILLTLFISHKIAGPLFRFKKELKTIEKGDLASDFRLRARDQLKDLAAALSDMKKGLRTSFGDLRDEIQGLENEISGLKLEQKKRSVLEDKIKQIKRRFGYFKV